MSSDHRRPKPDEPDKLSREQQAEAFGSALSDTANQAMDTGIGDATPLEIQAAIRTADTLRQSRDAIDIAAQKIRETAADAARQTREATEGMMASQQSPDIDPLTRGQIEAARDAERHARERTEAREERRGPHRDERSC
jgi:hypothetical protein